MSKMLQIGDKSVIGNSEDILSLHQAEIKDIHEFSKNENFYEIYLKPFLQLNPLIFNTCKKLTKINRN